MEVKFNLFGIGVIFALCGMFITLSLIKYIKVFPYAMLFGGGLFVIGVVIILIDLIVNKTPSVIPQALRHAKKIKRNPDHILTIKVRDCTVEHLSWLDADYMPTRMTAAVRWTHDVEGNYKDIYKPRYPMLKLVVKMDYEKESVLFESWLMSDNEKNRKRLEKHKDTDLKIYIKHHPEGGYEYFFDTMFLNKRL